MVVLQQFEYQDIMVVCCSRNSSAQIALQILSNGDITRPSFKLNVSNDVDIKVILDAMEVLWRSIEISNGIYI